MIMKRALSLLVAALGATIVSAEPLGPGIKAPELKVANIVKGKAVNLKKGVHVIEFWATWCGPCKVSIPHLTELAKKYEGKVDFTGVSVWERGDNQLDQVNKFVTEYGDKMAYNVAWDGEAKFMSTNWMEAAGQNGIPASFLVKDGQVVWVGHPMGGLDTAIDQVLAGTFDLTKAKEEFAKQAAMAADQAKQAAERRKAMKPLNDAIAAKDGDAVLKAIDEIAALEKMRPYYRYAALAQIGDARATEYGKKFADDESAAPMQLNQLAWNLVSDDAKKPNYELGLYMAQKAAERSEMKDAMILDTYGLALFRNGQKAKAIEVQTKAIELAKADKNVDDATRKELADRLALFQKAS
jgi:thiol-disulfide isomerase/thioredoxin